MAQRRGSIAAGAIAHPHYWSSQVVATVDAEVTMLDFEAFETGMAISTDQAMALYHSLGQQLAQGFGSSTT